MKLSIIVIAVLHKYVVTEGHTVYVNLLKNKDYPKVSVTVQICNVDVLHGY